MGSYSTDRWHEVSIQPVLSHPHHRLEGDELIDVLNVDGSTDQLPVSFAAAVFQGYEVQRGHDNAIGVRELVGFVSINHFLAPMGYLPHPLINGQGKVASEYLVVPLGFSPQAQHDGAHPE